MKETMGSASRNQWPVHSSWHPRLLLIGVIVVEGSATAPTASVEASSVVAAASAPEAATIEARHIRPLWVNLDLSPVNHRFVEQDCVPHGVLLAELNVGVSAGTTAQVGHEGPRRAREERSETDPLGWPVNLSHRMVMRLMGPHDWK